MKNAYIYELAERENLPMAELLEYARAKGYLTGISGDKVLGENIPSLLQSFREYKETKAKIRVLSAKLIITSGYTIEGYKIVEYVDFVSTETVMGMGFFKSIGASFDNMFGSESTLNIKIQEARELSKSRIKEKAAELDCNAIIGFDIDITMFGDSMVGVVCNGTAVKMVPT